MLAIKSVNCSYGKRPPFLAGGALMWPVDQYLLSNKSVLLDAYICINFFIFLFQA